MHLRRPLSAAVAIAPIAVGVIAIGAAPALAHGGHHRGVTGGGRADARAGRHGRSAAGARTVRLRGIVTGTPGAAGLQIVPLQRGERCVATAPAAVTVTLGPDTTIATPSDPTASWTDLNPGDEVTVSWELPAGTTSTAAVAAATVNDRGAPPEVTCTVHGVAAAAGTTDGVSLTTTGTRRRRHRSHHRMLTATVAVPVTVNVAFGPATTVVSPGNAAFGGADIASGDRLTVKWTAPQGTTFADLPDATRVIDLGAPPPIRYRATGTAATAGSAAGVTLDVAALRPNVAPALAAGTDLAVSFGGGTTFREVGDPGATLDDIQAGDRLVIVWSAPPGTPATSLPDAARVVDLGQAPTGT